MSSEHDDQLDKSPIRDCIYVALPQEWVTSNLDSLCSIPQHQMQPSNNTLSFIPVSEQPIDFSAYANTWTELLLNDDGWPSSMQTTPYSDCIQGALPPECSIPQYEMQPPNNTLSFFPKRGSAYANTWTELLLNDDGSPSSMQTTPHSDCIQGALPPQCSIPQCEMQPPNNTVSFFPERVSAYANTWTELLLNDDDSPSSMQTTPHSDRVQVALPPECSIPQCEMQPPNNTLSSVPQRVSAYANTWTELLKQTASLLNDDGLPSSMQTTLRSDNRQTIMSPAGPCHLTKLHIDALTNWWIRVSNEYQRLARLDGSPSSMQTTTHSDTLRKMMSPAGSCHLTKLQTDAFIDWWIGFSNEYQRLARLHGSPSSMQTTPHSDNRQTIMSPAEPCHLTNLQTNAFTDWWIESSKEYQRLARRAPRKSDEKPEEHFTRVITSWSQFKYPKEAIQAWKAWYRVIKVCTLKAFTQRQELKSELKFQTALQAWMTEQLYSYSMESLYQPQDSSWQISQGRTPEGHNLPAFECPNPSAVLTRVERYIANLRETLDTWAPIEDHATFASLTPAQALDAGAWEALLQVKDYSHSKRDDRARLST